jgi:uncharacterized protein
MHFIGRLGILSDTHGMVDARVLSCLRHCDLILHAGDIGDAGVIALLERESGRAVLSVAGNNDVPAKWPAPHHHVLASLEETVELELPGGTVAMEHGHRIRDTRNYHSRLRARHPAARMIVYGHTHVRVVDTSATPWVVNPGAAGRERTKSGPSCLVVDTRGDDWSIEQFCFPRETGRRRSAA